MSHDSAPINTLTDNHVHTSLCNHASGTMEDYVLAAIDKGLEQIVFLEHMEEGVQYPKTTWLSESDFDYYFEEGNRLRKRYQEQISIGLGVEVGYRPQHCQQLMSRLKLREFDCIGISYHFHKSHGIGDHLNLLSRFDSNVMRLNREEIIEIDKCYYNALIEAIQVLPGTFLCHLDAVLRNHPLRGEIPPPFDLVETLLDRLKEKKMALEINTSGITLRGEFFPTREIVTLAQSKNIPLVAGSDAHKPEDVARYFDSLENTLSI